MYTDKVLAILKCAVRDVYRHLATGILVGTHLALLYGTKVSEIVTADD